VTRVLQSGALGWAGRRGQHQAAADSHQHATQTLHLQTMPTEQRCSPCRSMFRRVAASRARMKLARLRGMSHIAR
jgi:hypothetical protein